MKKILVLSIMALITLMPLSGAINITMFTLSETLYTTKTNISNSNGYTNITVHEAWEMLTSTSDGIQIPIDIRTLEEWKQGRIDTPPPEDPVRWTNLHHGIGLQEFMEEYKDKQVVIYCRSANRSWTATKLLINNGFTGTIYHILGGINAWKDAGYTITSNQPPNTPTIDGPTSGKVGVEYDFKFQTTDPDGDDVYYHVQWGDGCGSQDWVGPNSSGEEVILNHKYGQKGTFVIFTQAVDIYDAESDWAILTVKMPRHRTIKTPFLILIQKHLNLF